MLVLTTGLASPEQVGALCSGAVEACCEITVVVGYQYRVIEVIDAAVIHCAEAEKERGRLVRRGARQAGVEAEAKVSPRLPPAWVKGKIPTSPSIIIRVTFAFTTWPFV